jgi:heterodisulfide reductase subunit C/nitrate reductase gamma subunit
MFNFLFLISLAFFVLGLIYKISIWFRKKIGISGRSIKTHQRALSAASGSVQVFFSSKILALIKAFLLDVLLQRRILQESVSRWLAHLMMFYGFILLLLMHALQTVVSEAIFSDYYSTVNPFWFLRDLFGAMVLVGVILALFRRLIAKPRRLRTSRMDRYAIAIVAIIVLSGIALEGLKISSHGEFKRMVEDYAGLDDEEEIQALEAVWVSEYGLVSPNLEGPFDEDIIGIGHDVHATNCMDCHSSSKWAFTGFAAAKLIKPVAVWLDQKGSIILVWYLHIIACFAGLAYLPFSKMFHIIATPVSLMASAVMNTKNALPANKLTRQIVEMDACTHCGSCSQNCSAAMVFEAAGNEYILPSEKMISLKKLVAGKKLSDRQLKAVQEGVYLCTHCDRCTVHCPSGIRLKELWVEVREALVANGPALPHVLSPYSFARGLGMQHSMPAAEYERPIALARKALAGRFDHLMNPDTAIACNGDIRGDFQLESRDNNYSRCFSCHSCTAVCPVVGNSDHPEHDLGLLPHQIMCCLALGLTEMASGARMIWDCLTCYKCQENCPQQVDICDLFFRLKNFAVQKADIR